MPTTVAQTKPGQVFKDYDECPDMVVIPSGSFLMGSNEKFASAIESPQHIVKVKSFALGKFEVTQEQWYSAMGSNPSINKGGKLPVEYVTWYEAQLFVQKLSQKTGKKYRLPSEAEWEYAARGGSTTSYPWGDSDAQLHDYAWSYPIAKATNIVGLKKPNQFGLFDMIGNVFEWTQDCVNYNYHGAPTDGSAWTKGKCSLRIQRGGSWNYGDLRGLRSAYRSYSYIESDGENRSSNGGFRVARDLP